LIPADLVWWGFSRVLVPVLAAVTLFFGLQDIGPAWSAAHGGGRPGTFAATERSCSTGKITTCGFFGTYVSDDGTVRLSWVWLDEPPRGLEEGDTTPVVYAGGRSRPTVYAAYRSTEWLIIGGLGVVAVVALAVWARTVLSDIRRVRRRRP
jgi:hypothetical protein